MIKPSSQKQFRNLRDEPPFSPWLVCVLLQSPEDQKVLANGELWNMGNDTSTTWSGLQKMVSGFIFLFSFSWIFLSLSLSPSTSGAAEMHKGKQRLQGSFAHQIKLWQHDFPTPFSRRHCNTIWTFEVYFSRCHFCIISLSQMLQRWLPYGEELLLPGDSASEILPLLWRPTTGNRFLATGRTCADG